jgi:hypothetical protein
MLAVCSSNPSEKLRREGGVKIHPTHNRANLQTQSHECARSVSGAYLVCVTLLISFPVRGDFDKEPMERNRSEEQMQGVE